MSRSQLVALTGLSRNAVKDLVAELVTRELVIERRPDVIHTPGRPSSVVAPNPGGPVVLAIDIQVDTIGLAFVGIGGVIPRQIRIDRGRTRLSPERTLLDIEEAMWALGDGGPPRQPVAVGIAVAGTVAVESGVVLAAPNLGWRDVELAAAAQRLVGSGTPVYIAYDGSLGCLGEHVRGTAVGVDDLLYVSGEVGVGGGAIVGGRPLVGADGHGGGWSHMMVNPNGSECRCGSIGCWETEIGEQVLLRRAGIKTPGGGRVAVDKLLRDASDGRPEAMEAIMATGRWVAIGIANLALVLNPRVVVLGGILERVFTFIESELRTEVLRRLPSPDGERLEIRASRLGEDAPLMGAGELAMGRQLDRLIESEVPDGLPSPVSMNLRRPRDPSRSVTVAASTELTPLRGAQNASGLQGVTDPHPPATTLDLESRAQSKGERRALGSRRQRVVGMLVADPGSPFVTEIVHGVKAEAAELGYEVSVIRTDATSEPEARRAAQAVDRRMDGLILVLAIEVDPFAQPVRGRGIPLVLLDHDRDAPGTTFVTAANRRGAITAIDHLIGLGHQRIGIITGTPGTGPARERLAGYRDSLVQAGIPYDSRLVVEGNFLESRGRTAMEELLSLGSPPTAVFASSDTAAFGAIAAIRAAGLNVPQDISVVGFDDVPDAARFTPRLTTVRQPLSEMGSIALRLLDRLIHQPPATELRIEVTTELVVRQSTGPYGRPRTTPRLAT